MVRLHGSLSRRSTALGCKVVIHPEDLPNWLDQWRTLVASGEGGEIEARLRRHDGAYRWFLTLARRVRVHSMLESLKHHSGSQNLAVGVEAALFRFVPRHRKP
jgi:PAS domain-containing protein